MNEVVAVGSGRTAHFHHAETDTFWNPVPGFTVKAAEGQDLKDLFVEQIPQFADLVQGIWHDANEYEPRDGQFVVAANFGGIFPVVYKNGAYWRHAGFGVQRVPVICWLVLPVLPVAFNSGQYALMEKDAKDYAVAK